MNYLGLLLNFFTSVVAGNRYKIPIALLLLAPAAAAQVSVEPRQIIPGREITVSYDFPRVSGEVFMHYGFNGWNLPLTGPDAFLDQSSNNKAFYKQQRMRWRWDWHRYQITIDVPRNARSLHMAFCRQDCSSGKWDNNSRQDYNWPIAFPYAGPVLQLKENDDPETSMRISFMNPYEDEAWLEFWEAAGSPEILKSEPAFLHTFYLTDLKPGKKYSYRVGLSSTHSSDVYSFRTLNRSDNELSFVLIGDAQDDGEHTRFLKTLEALATGIEDIDFVAGLGDYPWSDSPGDWWTFFDRAKKIMAEKIFISVAGNREASKTEFFRQLSTTQSGRLHGAELRAGPARFFVLDTNIVKKQSVWGDQLKWLQQRLENPGPETWIFVLGHHPVINIGARHFLEQSRYSELAAMISGRSDWYISGHEHLYQRTLPLKIVDGRFLISPSQADSTQYLVLPASGALPATTLHQSGRAALLRQLFAYPDRNVADDEIPSKTGFVKITLKDRGLTLTTFGFDPDSSRFNVTDTFQYQKP